MPYYRYYTNQLPTCPVCETRPVNVLESGIESRCKPCKAAAQALRRYWTQRGMPLSWERKRREYLVVLSPSVWRWNQRANAVQKRLMDA